MHYGNIHYLQMRILLIVPVRERGNQATLYYTEETVAE
jgi:hypothetical protein